MKVFVLFIMFILALVDPAEASTRAKMHEWLRAGVETAGGQVDTYDIDTPLNELVRFPYAR